MDVSQKILSNALSIEQMESRYRLVSGILSFFDIGCCFDTQPPMPPGK
ncbi:MAG: hypothetical protein ACK4E0_03200 [Chitinophagaceae bacterium]